MILPKHISRSRKGFTLIELLIVIGILGILAAGLLAALDPLEQLRRGRDTNRRRTATELVGALNRYYSVVGSFPWGNTASTFANVTSLQNTVLGSLVTAGELKSSFFNAIPSNSTINLIVVSAGTGLEAYSCFLPEAKSGSSDQSSIYSATTGTPAPGGGCPGGAGSTCYFCAR
jgi:prepilin-type N-terminal cleavage/methylation domain-containing protein